MRREGVPKRKKRKKKRKNMKKSWLRGEAGKQFQQQPTPVTPLVGRQAPSSPRPTMEKKWQDKTVQADLDIPAGFFVAVVKWVLSEKGEVSGFGVVEDAKLVWMCLTSRGAWGAVEASKPEVIAALELAREKGYSTVNFQWHTHPDIGAYWSGTDTASQREIVDEARDVMDKGEFWFGVFDLDSYLSRRVVWDGDEVSFNDGAVFLEGVKLPDSSSGAWEYEYVGNYYGVPVGAVKDHTEHTMSGVEALIEAFDSGDWDLFEGILSTMNWFDLDSVATAGRLDVYQTAEMYMQEWDVYGGYSRWLALTAGYDLSQGNARQPELLDDWGG
jgi:hypothetical protein